METLLTQLEVLLKTGGVTAAQVVVTAVGGILLSNALCKALHRLTEHSDHVDNATAHFALTLLRVVLYIGVGLLVALELGFSSTSIMAELGIISVAVSLALKDTLASMANGVLLAATKPFVQGDHVQVAGQDGVVRTIHLFYTELTNFDNQTITVPNQSVVGGTIVNYSRMGTRRLAVTASVAYGSDIDEVKRVLAATVAATNHILPKPAPVIRMTNMGASSIDFCVRVWVREGDYFGVMCDLNEGIYKALGRAGLEIPFPQMDVHLRDLPTVALCQQQEEDGHA